MMAALVNVVTRKIRSFESMLHWIGLRSYTLFRAYWNGRSRQVKQQTHDALRTQGIHCLHSLQKGAIQLVSGCIKPQLVRARTSVRLARIHTSRQTTPTHSITNILVLPSHRRLWQRAPTSSIFQHAISSKQTPRNETLWHEKLENTIALSEILHKSQPFLRQSKLISAAKRFCIFVVSMDSRQCLRKEAATPCLVVHLHHKWLQQVPLQSRASDNTYHKKDCRRRRRRSDERQ